jgi:hypothetical protein
MHKILKIIMLAGFLTASSYSRPTPTDSSTRSIKDSTTLLQAIGRTSVKITLGSLKVGAQYVGAIILGGVAVGIIHQPVIAGIGWTAASSFAVCVIGDWSERRGDYWWVFGAGAVGVIVFVPNMTNRAIDPLATVATAALTSATFEIITYYITERDAPIKVAFELKPSSLPINKNSFATNNPIPVFHIQIAL